MEQTIDVVNDTPQDLVYANFGSRFGASLIDSLVLAPLNFGLTYWCLTYVKSYPLSLVPTLIAILYKCYLEKKDGETVGKRVMGIKVVTENLQPLTNKEVVIRNYYYFVGFVFAVFSNYVLYTMPGFESATTYLEAVQLQSKATVTVIISYALSILFFVDTLLMINHKKNQTLHDRWAKTVVVKTKTL